MENQTVEEKENNKHSSLLKNIEEQLLSLMEEASQKVINSSGDELFSLIEPHPKFLYCEKYVVKLINDMEFLIKSNGLNVSKGFLTKVYLGLKEDKNANKKRLERIMREIS
jgi:membrane protease subunit (stomatin/prohibitin family)